MACFQFNCRRIVLTLSLVAASIAGRVPLHKTWFMTFRGS
jgi:hypothetical protein